MSDLVEVTAPAKANLFLRILAREESGYHALETLFCALSMADAVRVRRGAAGIRLEVEGAVDTGPPARNLCVRAAERFHAAIGRSPAVDIYLTKRIPSAAGLGAYYAARLNIRFRDLTRTGEQVETAVEAQAEHPADARA